MSRRVAASPHCPTAAPRLAVVVIRCWCPAPWRALVPHKQQNSPATSLVPPRGHPAVCRAAASLPVHPCRAGGYTSVPMLGGSSPAKSLLFIIFIRRCQPAMPVLASWSSPGVSGDREPPVCMEQRDAGTACPDPLCSRRVHKAFSSNLSCSRKDTKKAPRV